VTDALTAMIASAQISVLPLRQVDLGPAVERVRTTLATHGLTAKVGSMSTIVIGEVEAIFGALGEAFAKAAESGEVVMTVTISNACPIPIEHAAREPSDHAAVRYAGEFGPVLYADWRATSLGSITEYLERRLLLRLIGEVNDRDILDVGCGMVGSPWHSVGMAQAWLPAAMSIRE
jgi:uncharacterized protein YqgV (UPF0045/DUF77 family)